MKNFILCLKERDVQYIRRTNIKATIIIATITATDFLASGLILSAVGHQLSHDDIIPELELAMTKVQEDQSMAEVEAEAEATEAEERMESYDFFNQLKIMRELDDNILIDQVIGIDRNGMLSQRGISMGGSPHGHDIFDRRLADEFSRVEVDNYFIDDLCRDDRLFNDIINKASNGGAIEARISERSNLRRRT